MTSKQRVTDTERPPSIARMMRAATEASRLGPVFPLNPGSKRPSVRYWPERATTDPDAIGQWWAVWPHNIGLATGRAGLLVVDLDDSHGEQPPDRWAGARHGRDVLQRLADKAGEPYPGDTYTVISPSGGIHLYFRQPSGRAFRNTQAQLGWRIDTRGAGGYIVAAGSWRRGRYYTVANDAPVAELPGWLARALTPQAARRMPSPGRSVRPPSGMETEFVTRELASAASRVQLAQRGGWHLAIRNSALRLGNLVGAGLLGEEEAFDALRRAAQTHVGSPGFELGKACGDIRDGLRFGRARPLNVRRSKEGGA